MRNGVSSNRAILPRTPVSAREGGKIERSPVAPRGDVGVGRGRVEADEEKRRGAATGSSARRKAPLGFSSGLESPGRAGEDSNSREGERKVRRRIGNSPAGHGKASDNGSEREMEETGKARMGADGRGRGRGWGVGGGLTIPGPSSPLVMDPYGRLIRNGSNVRDLTPIKGVEGPTPSLYRCAKAMAV